MAFGQLAAVPFQFPVDLAKSSNVAPSEPDTSRNVYQSLVLSICLKKSCPNPTPLWALYEADVGQHKGPVPVKGATPGWRGWCGVVRNLGLAPVTTDRWWICPRWETDKTHIGNKFEFEHQPPFFAVVPAFGKVGAAAALANLAFPLPPLLPLLPPPLSCRGQPTLQYLYPTLLRYSTGTFRTRSPCSSGLVKPAPFWPFRPYSFVPEVHQRLIPGSASNTISPPCPVSPSVPGGNIFPVEGTACARHFLQPYVFLPCPRTIKPPPILVLPGTALFYPPVG